MRKSHVADYLAASTQTTLYTRSSPAILLLRLSAAGVPSQIAQLVYSRNKYAALLQHITAEPLWLLRRVLGQDVFISVNYCLIIDTYYLAEEVTIAIIQRNKKLITEERMRADEDKNAFSTVDYMPAGKVLRAHGELKFLVIPAYTVHQIMLQTDALIMVGHVVSKGENDERSWTPSRGE